ncbi:signal recognition particle-docking protein FtsY [Paracoccaceae bacterium]|nr:signal recognition particle-docking protein FtsY [Paracoccaceae bacterium]
MVTGFFKKLTNKLFTSSSKFTKNLDEAVSEVSENEVEEHLEKRALEEKLAKNEIKSKEISSSEKSAILQVEDINKESSPDKDIQKEPKAKSGVKKALDLFRSKPDVRKVVFNDEFLERLEDILISSDVGSKTALKISEKISSRAFGKKIEVMQLKKYLIEEITMILEPIAKPIPIYKSTPQIVLVVGVNGSGKTTTIGKLASQFKMAGKSVMIGAGDTFRAAAIEQLSVWAERVDVPIIKAEQGSDPASLAYKSVEKAIYDKLDLLFIDTAGRLQNKTDLMQELVKVVNVIKKVKNDAPENIILVLDATTGQNIISQVEVFQQMVNVTGIIMTKLDGSAKGGILISVADRFRLPIHAIGVGETLDDLQPFDPEEFATALIGDFRE